MTTQEENMIINIKEEPKDTLLEADDTEEHLINSESEIKHEFCASEGKVDGEFIFVKCEPVSSDVENGATTDSSENDNKSSEEETDFNIVTEIKLFKCATCNKQFRRKDYLAIHMKSHSDIKEFKCTVCNKEFLEKRYLKRHAKLHYGFNEFQCSICNKQFTYKTNLVVHMKTHSEVKEFKCTICNKEFSRKARLNSHIKLHSKVQKFICTFCDREFQDKRHLTRHTKVHTGVDKFTCSICNKQVTYKNNLISHMKAHLKDRRCIICNKQFAHNWALKIHMKLHNDVNEFSVSQDKRVSNLQLRIKSSEQLSSQTKNMDIKEEPCDSLCERQELTAYECKADREFVFVKCETVSSDIQDGDPSATSEDQDIISEGGT